MAKQKEKEAALKLRQDGMSIKDIAQRLSVSKSTVSYWCRDIQLDEKTIKNLAEKSKKSGVEAFLKIAENKRLKRLQDTEDAQKAGVEALGKLSKRDIFCIGLGLYWGEGYKKGNQEFGFSNSDPVMIAFYILWLKTVFNIERDQLTLRVSINHAHINRITVVENYWSDTTGIPLAQFTKTSLIKTASQKIYTNTEDHFGTLRIKVQKGTQMRREVLGMLSGIKQQIK